MSKQVNSSVRPFEEVPGATPIRDADISKPAGDRWKNGEVPLVPDSYEDPDEWLRRKAEAEGQKPPQ